MLASQTIISAGFFPSLQARSRPISSDFFLLYFITYGYLDATASKYRYYNRDLDTDDPLVGLRANQWKAREAPAVAGVPGGEVENDLSANSRGGRSFGLRSRPQVASALGNDHGLLRPRERAEGAQDRPQFMPGAVNDSPDSYFAQRNPKKSTCEAGFSLARIAKRRWGASMNHALLRSTRWTPVAGPCGLVHPDEHFE